LKHHDAPSFKSEPWFCFAEIKPESLLTKPIAKQLDFRANSLVINYAIIQQTDKYRKTYIFETKKYTIFMKNNDFIAFFTNLPIYHHFKP